MTSRIGDFAVRISVWFAKSHVVQSQFGKSLARLEMEVVAYVIAFGGRWLIRGLGLLRGTHRCQQ